MGWGYTQEGDQLSDVLKELTIPYVPFDKCYKEIVENFRKFVTFDKICAGYINNATSVCGGDSGGGLSFKNMFDDRYYVKAIVSASPATDVLQCDTNQYSVYTSIDKHIDFVRDLIAFNRRQKPLVCKQADCRNEKTENDDHCLLPNHPAHGTYSLASQSETYKPAKNVPKFTAILLTCHTGYEANPSGAGQFLCLDKRQWTPVPGTCTELQLPIKFNIHEVGGKSKQKCQEYGKHVFENGNIETLPGRSSLLGTNKNCPFTESKNTDSVQRAKQYEFPHMALIGFDVNNETVWLCAGSLISEKFVLTAAHCIRHLYFGLAKYVLLGDLIIHSLEDGTLTNQQISIKTRISHPSYSPPIKYHNIALLELEHNAILNAYVRPACLNTNPNLINEISIVSGWDQNEIFAGVKPYMQKATVTVFPNAECNDVYKENIDENLINGIDEKTLVCAGARYKSEVDVCQGGDPLQIVNSEVSCTYKIIGVTSFKKSCGVVNIPGVYTNVFGYLKWIENIVWP